LPLPLSISIQTEQSLNIYVIIWKAPVEYDSKLSHHEEHEDHEAKTEHIVIHFSCPSCPSWWI